MGAQGRHVCFEYRLKCATPLVFLTQDSCPQHVHFSHPLSSRAHPATGLGCEFLAVIFHRELKFVRFLP